MNNENKATQLLVLAYARIEQLTKQINNLNILLKNRENENAILKERLKNGL